MKARLLLLLVISICVSCSPESSVPLSPRVNHVMLLVSNIDASVEFYTKALGLEVTNRITSLTIENADGTSIEIDVKMAFLKFPGQDFVYEMSENSRDDKIEPAGVLFQHVGIDVKDIDAALKRALDTGAELVVLVRTVSALGVKEKTHL